MSNVKVNGNTYNGVTSIKLMKADNSGYAEYKEGAEAAEDFRDMLTAGGYTNIGDYESNEPAPYIGWLDKCGGGSISFPSATTAKGSVKNAKFENLLFPNVISLKSAISASGDYPGASIFSQTDVTGVLDLSSLADIQNGYGTFQNCNIGTLKLGRFNLINNMIASATITNFVWNVPSTTHPNMTNFAALMNSATKITNLYIPADIVGTWQTLIDNGTLTKIENLYSIDEWED